MGHSKRMGLTSACCYSLLLATVWASSHTPAAGNFLPADTQGVAMRKLMQAAIPSEEEAAEGLLNEDVMMIERELGIGVEPDTVQDSDDLDEIALAPTSEDGKKKIKRCKTKDECDKVNFKLMKAARTGDIETVKAMLKQGADPMVQRKLGQSPIHVATLGGHIEVVMKLLNKEPKVVNLQTEDGLTPLHIAATTGDLEIARALVDAGSQFKIKNEDGKTPLQLAKENKHAKIVKLLKGHGN